MKYTIIIDDKTKVGSSILEIARKMSELYKSIIVYEGLSDDEKFILEMKESRKSGKGNKEKLLEFLNN